MTHQTGIHGKRGPSRAAGSRRSFPAAAPGCAVRAPRVVPAEGVGGSAADPSGLLRGSAHPLSPRDAARTRLGTAKLPSASAAPVCDGVCAAGGPSPAVQHRAERYGPAVSPKSQRGEGGERRGAVRCGATPPPCVPLPAASRRGAALEAERTPVVLRLEFPRWKKAGSGGRICGGIPRGSPEGWGVGDGVHLRAVPPPPLPPDTSVGSVNRDRRRCIIDGTELICEQRWERCRPWAVLGGLCQLAVPSSWPMLLWEHGEFRVDL